jgi:hypothetical protein
MSGHTPEEWGVWPEINTFNVDGKMITGNTTGMHIAHVRICGGEGERYARLMAAAPELLEACRESIHRLTDMFDRHERKTYPANSNPDTDLALLTASLRLAIAKATGAKP